LVFLLKVSALAMGMISTSAEAAAISREERVVIVWSPSSNRRQ
jgi:hypothetical protein